MKLLNYIDTEVDNKPFHIAENFDDSLKNLGIDEETISNAKNTILVSAYPGDYYPSEPGNATKIVTVPVNKIIGTSRSTPGLSVYENVRCVPDDKRDYTKFQRCFKEFIHHNSLEAWRQSFADDIEAIPMSYYADADEYFVSKDENHRTLTAMLIGAPLIKAKVYTRKCDYYMKERYDIEQAFKQKYNIKMLQGNLMHSQCHIRIYFSNPDRIISGFIMDGSDSQINNINLLAAQIEKDQKTCCFLNKIKNETVKSFLVKMASANNYRIPQYYKPYHNKTNPPEIKLYKLSE